MSPKYRKLFGQNYEKIFLECARTGRNFQDEHFPTNDSSLYKHPNRRRTSHHHRNDIEWKRCKDITSSPHLFLSDNRKFGTDVVQGVVGNCWLVSAIGVLATHPKLLQKVIPKASEQGWYHSNEPGKKMGVYHFRDTERHPGIFRFRFYRFGEWIEVVVDDYLPVRNDKLIYAHSKNKDEMWVSLLEKAYAKLCRCYESLEAGTASDSLVDLTGTIPDSIELPNISNVINVPHNPDQCNSSKNTLNKDIVEKMGLKNFIMMMQIAIGKGALMSCSMNVLEGEMQQERLPNGLVVGHAYGITDIQKIRARFWKRLRGEKDTVLIRLHNPWGEVEWNGAWSDKSEKWEQVSKSKRKKLGFKIADDGDFWMSFDDWIINFSNLIICRNLNTSIFSFEKRWHFKTFFGEWSVEHSMAGGCVNHSKTFYQNPQYRIITHTPTTIIIGLMQEDSRADIDRENLTIGFVIFKIEENRKYRIHKSTYDVAGRVTYINTREVTARITLKSGKYILIPSTFNPNEVGKYFLRIFSANKIKIEELKKDKPKKKWWYPIIYWKKSYFVGMIRVRLMSVDLNKSIGKAYIKITFADLNGRIRQKIVSPKFITKDNNNSTEIGIEYVFYSRDPSTSGLLFQLFKKRALSSDVMFGEVRLLVEPYSQQNKQNRTWEITKTFTKIVKVPKDYLKNTSVMTESEGEILPDESDRIEKKTENTVTRKVFGNNGNNERSNQRRPQRGHKKGKRNAGGMDRSSKELVPQIVDAKIGELKIRLSYFSDVNS